MPNTNLPMARANYQRALPLLPAAAIVVLLLIPMAEAYDSTTFTFATAANVINSLQNRFLVVGTSAGSSTSLDAAMGAASIRNPTPASIVNIAIELTGTTGVRSTNPFEAEESVSWQLRKAVVSGNTWVDDGLVTNITTVSSATVFPFRSNVSGTFDVADRMLYVQETPTTLTLPRTILRTFRFDLSVGNQTLDCSSGCDGVFTGSFTGVVVDTAAIPYEIAFPLALITLSLAGVGVSFASRTNPIPAFAGMIVQVICWMLTTTYSTDLSEEHLTMFTLFFGAMLMLLALKAYAMLWGKGNAEENMS